ncbi:hypothetical protein Droror1_Dr00024784 [Drosera rotundifolia]
MLLFLVSSSTPRICVLVWEPACGVARGGELELRIDSLGFVVTAELEWLFSFARSRGVHSRHWKVGIVQGEAWYCLSTAVAGFRLGCSGIGTGVEVVFA